MQQSFAASLSAKVMHPRNLAARIVAYTNIQIFYSKCCCIQ